LTNTANHNKDTTQGNNLYVTQANLTMYQMAAYHSGIEIFNNLPMQIKNVADNIKKLKVSLKQFLYSYSFYILEEYFNQS
jgi:hypothetical protein